MQLKILSAIFLAIMCIVPQGKCLAQSFDRSAFYSVMATGSVDDLDKELTLLDAANINEKEAYRGALLMKKAGLVTIPAEKLKFFKSGRIKLETAILHDSSNAEYRFLRLTIEEHAPKIVKYKKDLDNDKAFVISSFKDLPPIVQQAIKDYCKNSQILHAKDF